jgi:hypothetical protein
LKRVDLDLYLEAMVSAGSEYQEENARGEGYKNQPTKDAEKQRGWRRRDGAWRALRWDGRIEEADTGALARRAAGT